MKITRNKLTLWAIVIVIYGCCWISFAQPKDNAKTEAEETVTWQQLALHTWSKYVRPDYMESEYIPLSCWHKTIRELNPLYVYQHNVHIVVVLKRKGDIEKGVYLSNVLSSFGIPAGREFDGFKLTWNNHSGYFEFARKRPANQAAQGTS